MKITINKELIKSLKPCADRYENYLRFYSDFSGTLEEFLFLPEISHQDKLWVSLRLLPRELVEVFAIDCAVSAANKAYYAANTANAADYAADYSANNAANNAAYAATSANAADAANAAYSAAAYAAYYAAERAFQIEAIIYLSNIEE